MKTKNTSNKNTTPKGEQIRDGYLCDLPEDIQTTVMNIHKLIVAELNALVGTYDYKDIKDSQWAMSCIDQFLANPSPKGEIGAIRVYKKGKTYRCMIQITGHFRNHQYGWIEELLHEIIKRTYVNIKPKIRKYYNYTITNEGEMGEPFEGFDVYPPNKIVKAIWDKLDDRNTRTLKESAETEEICEATNLPATSDITEAEAKSVLTKLAATIIKDHNKVNASTLNTISNCINQGLLSHWARGYRKLTLTVDSRQGAKTLEFKAPRISKDFVERFIAGRETMTGLIHRSPEINIKVSADIFNTMKMPADLFNFFRSAVKYYDARIEKYAESLYETMAKLNRKTGLIIQLTNLKGIVSTALVGLFKFDNVDMSNRTMFDVNKDDITTLQNTINNIVKRYKNPGEHPNEIIKEIQNEIQRTKTAMQKSFPIDENYDCFNGLAEAVEKLFTGKYDNLLREHVESVLAAESDNEWRKTVSGGTRILTEQFGVKKLKKIPADLVSYIVIEAESIKDANDKMMISSYCLSKLEIVEWYIELLEVGSKKYIVPHTKPYLENIRTQLLAAHKKIMATPIPKADRPIIDIQYPKGYEG